MPRGFPPIRYACCTNRSGAFAAHGLDRVFTEKYAGQTRMVAGETVNTMLDELVDKPRSPLDE